MSQALTCIALPAPACMHRGVFPQRDEILPLPADLARRVGTAGQIMLPPALLAAWPPAATGTACAQATLTAPDMGTWHGQSLKDLPPADVARWVADEDFAPPGGESRAAHLHRIARWLDALPPAPAQITVLAPATVVRAIVVAALGGSAAMLSRLDIAPLTRSRLTRHTAWRVAISGAPLP